jgi:3-oxoacyl-[acyl-carrier protein] reductase
MSPSALITGASRGIGRGAAHLLAERGWNLTITARNEEPLRQTKKELEAAGATVRAVAGDLAGDNAGNAEADIVETHASAFGSLNALILAAGVGSAGRIDSYPLRRFDKQLAVNLRAPFALVSRALPLLRDGAARDTESGDGGEEWVNCP